ncbi:MAG: glycosyltransferase family 2 protein [Acidimicrobiaceae bacterium]|nr:glycosyltransferase family 2 protein [Acidimicrobiaceae bacterium]
MALAGLYLFALAVAAFFYRESPRSRPCSRLTVLVPAHDEASLVQRCIAALQAQDYSPDLFETVVIVDNCTDNTEQLARASGATVLVRDAPHSRGKGQALRWAMDQLLAGSRPPDAFVVVDADSVADRGLLTALAQALELGADAVQAEYLVLPSSTSARVELRAVAFLLFHRVRFAGRSVLGLPCALVGNGMLLSRRLLERCPWDAFTGAEDLEYSLTLRLNGVRPMFTGTARLWGPVPVDGGSARVQRERWEGGRLRILRTALPRLLHEILRRRRLSLVDCALDLAVPPLGLLTAAALVGTSLGVGLVRAGVVTPWALIPWVVGLGGICGHVMGGLVAARAPRWMYRRLFSAPIFLLEKIVGTVAVVRSRNSNIWVRTERPSANET